MLLFKFLGVQIVKHVVVVCMEACRALEQRQFVKPFRRAAEAVAQLHAWYSSYVLPTVRRYSGMNVLTIRYTSIYHVLDETYQNVQIEHSQNSKTRRNSDAVFSQLLHVEQEKWAPKTSELPGTVFARMQLFSVTPNEKARSELLGNQKGAHPMINRSAPGL